jgi:hypothetical protein
LDGSLIDAMMVMADLFVRLVHSVAKVLKVEFEAATDLIIVQWSTFFVGIAEVVGSTPTRSISFCDESTVLF